MTRRRKPVLINLCVGRWRFSGFSWLKLVSQPVLLKNTTNTFNKSSLIRLRDQLNRRAHCKISIRSKSNKAKEICHVCYGHLTDGGTWVQWGYFLTLWKSYRWHQQTNQLVSHTILFFILALVKIQFDYPNHYRLTWIVSQCLLYHRTNSVKMIHKYRQAHYWYWNFK